STQLIEVDAHVPILHPGHDNAQLARAYVGYFGRAVVLVRAFRPPGRLRRSRGLRLTGDPPRGPALTCHDDVTLLLLSPLRCHIVVVTHVSRAGWDGAGVTGVAKVLKHRVAPATTMPNWPGGVHGFRMRAHEWC